MVENMMSYYSLSKELVVFILSAVPIIELRGAIPLGYSLNLPIWKTYIISVLGSTLPAPFLIIFFHRVLVFLKEGGHCKAFTDYLDKHLHKKSKKLRSASLIGLFIFVAIPLPSTGAYTGSMLASVLNIRLKYALPIIFLANATAGVIVMMLSHMIF